MSVYLNNNEYRDRQRSLQLQRKYGITLDEYMDILERQEGSCALCGKIESAKSRWGSVKMLAVDHNHETGQVRGLLCDSCNRLIGSWETLVKPRFSQIQEYLEGNTSNV